MADAARTWAAFLGSINVGGRRVKNDQLVEALADAGFDRVETYRASGNLILGDPEGRPAGAVTGAVEAGLAAGLGFEVPVILRPGDAVAGIAAAEPFPEKQVEAAKGKEQVVLAARPITAAMTKECAALGTEVDLLEVAGGELYWLPIDGVQGTGLDSKALAKVIGHCTVRTLGTLEGIAKKL